MMTMTTIARGVAAVDALHRSGEVLIAQQATRGRGRVGTVFDARRAAARREHAYLARVELIIFPVISERPAAPIALFPLFEMACVSLHPASEEAAEAMASLPRVVVRAGDAPATIGRSSVQDPHTAGKVQVGIPSTEARLSRSQCKLTVAAGPAEGAEDAGGEEGVATLQTAQGAKNPVCVRRGGKRKLVQPGESFQLLHEDVIELGTSVACFRCW